MSRLRLIFVAWLVLVPYFSPAVTHAVTYQAKLLEPSAGRAVGISGDSQVGILVSGHAGMWTGGSECVDLHPIGLNVSMATSISGGTQVGWGTDFDFPQRQALLWNNTAASVISLHPAGFNQSEANSVANGTQVGSGHGGATDGNLHALLWHGSAASMVDLHPAGYLTSEAHDVFENKQVGLAAGMPTAYSSHAFMWNGTPESAVDLNPPAFAGSAAYGIDATSQVGAGGGGAYSYYSHALLWKGSAESVVDLHPTGFIASSAEDVSLNTQVGYGNQDENGVFSQPRALAWHGSADSVVNLHLLLSGLPVSFIGSRAESVDSNGTIIGWGHDKDFNPYSIIWTPVQVPEPGTGLQLICGFVGTACVVRRKTQR